MYFVCWLELPQRYGKGGCLGLENCSLYATIRFCCSKFSQALSRKAGMAGRHLTLIGFLQQFDVGQHQGDSGAVPASSTGHSRGKWSGSATRKNWIDSPHQLLIRLRNPKKNTCHSRPLFDTVSVNTCGHLKCRQLLMSSWCDWYAVE